jgi:hypothetical protein
MRISLPYLAAALTIAIAATGITSLQQQNLQVLKRRSEGLTTAQLQETVGQERDRLSILGKLPNFGFRNLAADAVFLNFLQYFGDEDARAKTGYDLSPEYFEIALDRDPYFRDGYFFLSGSSSLFAGLPERTIGIIDRNLPRLTPTLPERAYYVWRYKATDELLFMGDSAAAARSFGKVVKWAAAYPDAEGRMMGGAAAASMVHLQRKPTSRSARIGAWTMVLSSALDKGTRNRAIREITALGGRFEPDGKGAVRIVTPGQD